MFSNIIKVMVNSKIIIYFAIQYNIFYMYSFVIGDYYGSVIYRFCYNY
jgi:hypothetical protein